MAEKYYPGVQPFEPQNHALKAGAAQVDITPEPGILLTGFLSRLGPSTGVHDPLYARALALEAGGQRALLITCDLLALDAPFVTSARASIWEATGIPPDHVMIACTHTHSGPATVFLRDCGEVDRPYLERLCLLLVEAARNAVSGMREAKVGTGRGSVSQGAQDRRRPGRPIDRELSVVAFQDSSGRLIAVLANFACHPVCLDHTNRLISADYPGVLARVVQEQNGAVVLFANAATGDINPDRMGDDFSYAENLGRSLAAETLRVLEGLAYQDASHLQVCAETLALAMSNLPTREALDQKITEHRQGFAEAEAAGDVLRVKLHRAMLGWAEATLAGVLAGSLPASVPAEIQVIRLGVTAMVGIPGEIFNELGSEIKSSVSAGQVLVMGYTNNDIGYIPTRQAYALGGYEINDAFKFYGYPAVLAPEAGDLVKQAAARLLEGCSDRPK